MRRPGRRNTSIALVVLAILVAAAVTLGIVTDLYELGDLPRNILLWVRHNGPLGAVTALYAEESGIPVLLPGDVFVVYMGRRSQGLPGGLIAWAVMVLAVVLGATNLYWISRRWGRRLLGGRVGHVVHLTPARLDRAEAWFHRYGVWALIFGRHIPGCRIPITVAAGTLEVPYVVFAASVALSSAVWVGLYLLAGALFGRQVERYLVHHRNYMLAIPLVLALVAGTWIARRLRREAPTA